MVGANARETGLETLGRQRNLGERHPRVRRGKLDPREKETPQTRGGLGKKYAQKVMKRHLIPARTMKN